VRIGSIVEKTVPMPSQSPFAKFYDQVFAIAGQEQQESFLRQLFTLDAALCASFEAYIYPPLRDLETEQAIIISAVAQIREKIKRYKWNILFDMDPTAEDYSTELTELIDKDIIGDYLLKMEAYCRTGDLLSAVSCLRIIEQGTNLNWEDVEEPAGYYGDEVRTHIGFQFDFFADCFLGSIFSPELIKEAIAHAEIYHSDSGGYFDHSKCWEDVLDTCKARLAGKI
jgi:hypothetical protein